MRTNKFIPFLIALLLHLLVLASLHLNLKSKSNGPFSGNERARSIDLSQFSVAKKNKIQEHHSINKMAKKSDDGLTAISANPIGTVGFPTQVQQTTSATSSIFLQIHEPLYPSLARKKGLEGKVKIRAIYSNGIITKVEVIESSGVTILDDSVINAVREWKLTSGSNGSFEKSFEFKLKN